MTGSLPYIVLYSACPERIRDFYECLGINFESENHPGGPWHYAGLAGDFLLEIYPAFGGTAPRADTALPVIHSRLSAMTITASLATAGFLAHGAALVRHGSQLKISDPEGRSVWVECEKED